MKHNAHTIKKIRYRDLSDYLSLRTKCNYENPAEAPEVEHLLVEKIFFIFNKLCRYFLPIFSQRYNIFGYFIDKKLIGFHHPSQRHPLWPYSIKGKTKKKYTCLLAVEHSHRRKGIGKKLSSYVAKYYKGYDIFNIISITNPVSIKIATSLGFQLYDQVIVYTSHLPIVKHKITKFKRLFSIRNNPQQIDQIFELYKNSLFPAVLRIEEPLVDYFKISPLYRINLYLFNLLGIFNEGRYMLLSNNKSHVKVFVQVRNYITTRRSEMLMIASEKLSDSDLNWVKGIIDSLANIGQKEITTYARKHQTNIQDAFKALNFTQKEEYLCFVRKFQQAIG
jgi:GNAT superfamily N-acetyltransferase